MKQNVHEYYFEGFQKNFLPIEDLLGESYNSLTKAVPSVKLSLFPKLSETIGGFRAREFSILCGSTGAGKTTFMANLSASLITDKVPHYVASVETGSLDYVRRILSVLSDEDLNTGEVFPEAKIYSIHKRYGHMLTTKSLQLALHENRTSVEQLMAEILFAHENFGAKIAVIDNLNFFMDVTTVQNQILEMDRVIHELVIFCKQVDIHLIMVMHPNKGTTKNGSTRVETEYDIKGSSTAVQEAHNVFLLNRPSKENVESKILSPNNRELKIAKMRRLGGSVGKVFILSTENYVRYREEGILG